MCLRLDQSVQEPSAISSQSCQASDCHCRKMFLRLDQICEQQWQRVERQIGIPMAGRWLVQSKMRWSNLGFSPVFWLLVALEIASSLIFSTITNTNDNGGGGGAAGGRIGKSLINLSIKEFLTTFWNSLFMAEMKSYSDIFVHSFVKEFLKIMWNKRVFYCTKILYY